MKIFFVREDFKSPRWFRALNLFEKQSILNLVLGQETGPAQTPIFNMDFGREWDKYGLPSKYKDDAEKVRDWWIYGGGHREYLRGGNMVIFIFT